jgi:hypothetical protein
VLVVQCGGHRGMAHPVHQLARRGSAFGRQVVARVPQVRGNGIPGASRGGDRSGRRGYWYGPTSRRTSVGGWERGGCPRTT